MDEPVGDQLVVSFGEALWDLLPEGPVLGGAPLNFAYRIQNLGYRSILVSCLGNDDLGRTARRTMTALGMATDYVLSSETYSTGTVKIHFDAQKNPDYTIIEDVAYDFISLDDRLIDIAGEADCLCFGTLIQRRSRSRETLCAMLAAFRGRFILCDVNLRQNCWSRETVQGSIARCNVLKLSHEEVPVVAEILGAPAEPLSDFARYLFSQQTLDFCVVTLGAQGAYAGSREGQETLQPGYRIELADPCGAGDAFTAGFISGLLADKSLDEACRIGNVMGAMVTSQPGATQPIRENDMATFMRRNSIYHPASLLTGE